MPIQTSVLSTQSSVLSFLGGWRAVPIRGRHDPPLLVGEREKGASDDSKVHRVCQCVSSERVKTSEIIAIDSCPTLEHLRSL